MKRYGKKLLHLEYRLPAPILGFVRGLYGAGVVGNEAVRALYALLLVKPVMQAKAEGGRRLRIEQMPYMRGKGRLSLGCDIYWSGKIGVSFLARAGIPHSPLLKMGDRTFIGHQCSFAVSDRIEIGSDCMIAAGTKIQDNDGHPLEPGARLRHEKVAVADIKPVVLGNNVWIAPRCTILKGVVIGDNAVVGTGSVVTRDVPANTLVAGVPARIVREL